MNLSDACPFAAGAIVYPYLRHSPGDQQSIYSQEAYVLDWCTKHQLVVPRVFKDEARSGSSTAGRDDFLALIDTLRDAKLKPKPAGVLLWSFSRFARDYDDAEFYKADLRRRGYIIHSLTDQIPDGPFGRVIESITHWKDEERLREISKDSRRGLQWLAQQGYSVGGRPPRGYKKSAPVNVGFRKNGEPRLAYKWEQDEECQERVNQAWRMKLVGELNWSIHRDTRLFKSINCYTTFFTNITYAGYRKCGTLLVPNAHPAYVSKEDFDAIQARREPLTPGVPRGGLRGHPRRRNIQNPFLLTGIFYCGSCGSAMIGHGDGHSIAYRCGKQKQQGHQVCRQPIIIARPIHDLVIQWLSSDVLTAAHLLAARSHLHAQLNTSQADLKIEQRRLREELAGNERRIANLLNGLEESGWSVEIERRIAERRVEKTRTESELNRVEQLLERGNLDISDEALLYLAEQLSEQLARGTANEARAVVQRIVKRVELHQGRLSVQYVPPLTEVVTSQLHGYRQWPVRNSNPRFCLERAAS